LKIVVKNVFSAKIKSYFSAWKSKDKNTNP
jgi:hypothetical protein